LTGSAAAARDPAAWRGTESAAMDEGLGMGAGGAGLLVRVLGFDQRRSASSEGFACLPGAGRGTEAEASGGRRAGKVAAGRKRSAGDRASFPSSKLKREEIKLKGGKKTRVCTVHAAPRRPRVGYWVGGGLVLWCPCDPAALGSGLRFFVPPVLLRLPHATPRHTELPDSGL
jgi:hypothetical protein